VSDYYHDDPVAETAVGRILPKFIATAVLVVASYFFFQTTLAANIALNSGGYVEFGQSLSATASCAGSNSLTVTPKSSFVNVANGTGSYYLSSVQVTDIPASCDGKDFNLSFYDSVTGSSALPIFSFFGENKRVATVYNRVGYFAQGFQSSGTEASSDSGSFTITFKTPVAIATDVMKVTLQSIEHKDWAEAAISSNSYHTCAVLSTGVPKCWGYNSTGQLGDNSTTQRTTPGDVQGLSGVIQIAAGLDFSCALLNTGTVKCWGNNNYGQLGNGTGTLSRVPVTVSNLSGVSAITAGWQHACAVLKTGAAKCWGLGALGRLGDGASTNRLTPVDVSGLSSGVTVIAASSWHTCAVLSTGAAKCWGYNSEGQFGNGTTNSSSTPVDVSGLNANDRAVAIGLGEHHTCILLSSGSVKCSGKGYEGQLGNSGNSQQLNPTGVSGITTAVAISSGRYHNCALLSSGAVTCWGYNANGQIGDGTKTQRNSPVYPAALSSGFRAISASLEHTCAVLSTGAAKCWGQNANGQLGDTTYTSTTSPVNVIGIP